MAQWYGKVPGVWKVNENRPAGGTGVEFHLPSSDVEVWATESVLVHVIVVPAETSATSGLNAVVVNAAAPAGIDTAEDDADGVGDGVGVGAVEDEYPPQPNVKIRTTELARRRNNKVTDSMMNAGIEGDQVSSAWRAVARMDRTTRRSPSVASCGPTDPASRQATRASACNAPRIFARW